MGEVIGGAMRRRVPARAARPGGWTKAKQELFLDHLAVTCNVTQSALKAGFAANTAHKRRRRDPAFDAAWSAALDQGYALLEGELLARAMGGDAAAAQRCDRDAAPFDPELAFRLLRQRPAMPGGRRHAPLATKRVPIEQVEASLRRKLDVLEKQLKGTA